MCMYVYTCAYTHFFWKECSITGNLAAFVRYSSSTASSSGRGTSWQVSTSRSGRFTSIYPILRHDWYDLAPTMDDDLVASQPWFAMRHDRIRGLLGIPSLIHNQMGWGKGKLADKRNGTHLDATNPYLLVDLVHRKWAFHIYIIYGILERQIWKTPARWVQLV